MRKLLYLVLFLLITSGFVYPDFETGNTLYQKLTTWDKTKEDKDFFDYANALGYIIGVYDAGIGVYFEQPIGATRGQITDIAIKYLEQNPERRNEFASILLLDAFKKAFLRKKQSGIPFKKRIG